MGDGEWHDEVEGHDEGRRDGSEAKSEALKDLREGGRGNSRRDTHASHIKGKAVSEPALNKNTSVSNYVNTRLKQCYKKKK